MPWKLEFESLPELLRVVATGEAVLADFIGLIDVVGVRTERTGHRRVLVNLLGVTEGLKFTDHFSLGDEVARKLGHLERVASVVPEERRTRTSEKVANAQGVRLKVFTAEADALLWLAETQ